MPKVGAVRSNNSNAIVGIAWIAKSVQGTVEVEYRFQFFVVFVAFSDANSVLSGLALGGGLPILFDNGN